MATVSKWTPFDVALDITATAATVTRTSATQFTVKINASWETYYSGAKTNYGMTASSGGGSVNLNTFGTKSDHGSGSFTGTYSISGNGSSTKTITVTFRNFNNDNGNSATKSVSFSVTVPAWTSYTVKYNANGGSGAPSSQTKWKDQALTLSSSKPTRTGYSFQGWATSASGSVAYAAGAKYTANAAVTLYAVWKANTYAVTYNANGGTGAPATQTKTYGTTLTLSSTKPTRANYTFKGWATSASATAAAYSAGASYTTNAAITLYAVWELAYTKPTIASFSVSRCSSDGTASGEGTYARVKFNWSTSKSVTKVLIDWVSGAGDSGSYTVAASGTSGSVDQIVGGGLLSAESSYTIRVTVTDAGGTFTASRSLAGFVVPFEALAGGKGVAFGKVAEMQDYADFAFRARHRDHMEFDNSKSIYGIKPDGTKAESFIAQNGYGNTIIGLDNYSLSDGNTHIYGMDVVLYSRRANSSNIRPYYRTGDSITIDILTAGYVSNSKTEIYFTVPLTRPLLGITSVTASSNNGFIIRQNDKYTHGSTATVYAIPTKYVAAMIGTQQGVKITATFSDTTNAVNNSAVGIRWSGTLTFA